MNARESAHGSAQYGAHDALFDVDELAPRSCPAGHCQAIRTGPDQARVPTCAHDLDPDRKHRPKGCLNEYRPDDTEIPY